MYWILAILIGLALGIWVANDIGFSWVAYIGWPLVCIILCLLIAVLFGLLIGVTTPDALTYDTNLTNSTEIVAMNDNISVEGYRWYVNSDNKYYVLLDTDKGLLSESYDADKVYIKYTDGTPHIETYINAPRTHFWTVMMTKGWYNYTTYVIYVPEDANITNDFIVDLE